LDERHILKTKHVEVRAERYTGKSRVDVDTRMAYLYEHPPVDSVLITKQYHE
jgi:hypothetical protein